MKKKNIIAHTFQLSPYPRELWVVKGGDTSELRDLYCFPNGTETKDYFEEIEGYEAFTSCLLRDKKTRKFGYLVYCTNTVKNDAIAHEAGHVVVYLFDDIEITIDVKNDEPFAYMLGYVYGCIESVVRNKKNTKA